MVCGIGLFSGGLDSMLAVRVLQEQGIHVIAVCFVTPFFGPEKARAAARHLSIPLRVIDITDEHVAMLQNPRYGYGRNMNPCIDCHGLMFREAGKLMDECNAQFLFSGEVLGERPMSQNKNSLRAVEKLSGHQGYVLRPLSAQLLPETIPEQQGLVDRSQLLAISGRSRKPQLELARKFGITEYPEPAGGCRLTEPGYSKRLKELMEHGDNLNRRSLELLGIGRHLRLPGGVKIIIGRNKHENQRLKQMARDRDVVLCAVRVPGPTVLVPQGGDEQTLLQAAAICARYSDMPPDATVSIRMRCGEYDHIVQVVAAPDEIIRSYMI
ncbi:MAG: tRNA 4-thiouridine(8) synthase ThiI [Desulfobacterota bacterium]|nr:tRNA 4-thiouridine(8) synthase ThiI [Thermodesulfobacteriota bacterium]